MTGLILRITDPGVLEDGSDSNARCSLTANGRISPRTAVFAAMRLLQAFAMALLSSARLRRGKCSSLGSRREPPYGRGSEWQAIIGRWSATGPWKITNNLHNLVCFSHDGCLRVGFSDYHRGGRTSNRTAALA